MPDTIAPDTTTTPGDGPVVGETPTREFSPADLGIDTTAPEFVTPAETPETPETPEAPPEDDAIGLALKRGRPARDLTDLDEAEQKLFKSMSREAYEKLYPLYKKFKGREKDLDEVTTLREKLTALEKAQTKPASFYDREDAYLLQQDFRDALLQSRQLDTLLNHWQDQLAAAEEGKPVYDISQDANGNLQLSAPIEVTPRVKAQILATLTQVSQAKQTHQAKIESLKTSAREQFTNYRSGLNNVYEKVFAKYKDVLDPLAAKELEQFPEFTRDRIETKLMANALALIKHIVAADKATKQQAGVNAANANGGKVAGPTVRSLTTGPKPTPAPEANEAEYKKFKLQFGV